MEEAMSEAMAEGDASYSQSESNGSKCRKTIPTDQQQGMGSTGDGTMGTG
jgi:hypothetical protein